MKLSTSRRASSQGSLDGLCGIYSVINAMTLIDNKNMSDEERAEFFVYLTNLLDDGRALGEIIRDGIGFRKLGELVDVASRRRRNRTGWQIQRRVAMNKDPDAFDDFWQLLASHVDPAAGKTAILGISGAHDHWTVIYSVSAKRIELHDSDGLRHLDKARCGLAATDKIKHILWPTQTYLLTKVPWEEEPV